MSVIRRERIKSLEIRNMVHAFEGAEKPLFNDINYELPIGKTVVVTGSPGCGKSILLRILSGLVEPTKGDVVFNGRALKDLSFEEFTPMRLSTAVCPENGGLLMNKTLYENMRLSLLYHNQWRRERSTKLMDNLVEIFSIGEFLNLRPASVSAGVRKKAGLIRAFLSNAQILFLDEPSLGIGEGGVNAFNVCMQNFRSEGHTDQLVVMATTDRVFTENAGFERFTLVDGRLVPMNKVAA